MAAANNESSACSLDNLPPEVMKIILDKLSSRDRLMLCLVNQRFADLVMGFNEFKQEMELKDILYDLKGGCKKYDRYSLFSYRLDENQATLRLAEEETLLYISKYLPNLKELDIEHSISSSFPGQFRNLETLKLSTGLRHYSLVSQITALPKLRVLSLGKCREFSPIFRDSKLNEHPSTARKWHQMKMLESLELEDVDDKYFQEIVSCCTDRLQNIFFRGQIGQTIDIKVLLDNCPGLKSVGMDCRVTENKIRALIKKLGPQLQYLHISSQEKKILSIIATELNKFESIELRALAYQCRNPPISIEENDFLCFLDKHGNKLRRLSIKGVCWMNKEIVPKILETCPLVNKQKYSDLDFSKMNGFTSTRERNGKELDYVR